MGKTFENESLYRAQVAETLGVVERALQDVDPDVLECEDQFGVVTLKLASGAKWILSAQPSVQQIWLAVASLGVAYHFDFNPKTQKWVDDKGHGIELMTFLEKLLREQVGLEIQLVP
jgi:iron donor protein CyaY